MEDVTENEEKLKGRITTELASAEASLQLAATHLRALRIAMPGDRAVRSALVRIVSLHLEVLSFQAVLEAMRGDHQDTEVVWERGIDRLD